MPDPYLTSLLRPLSQRRQRAASTVDPLESAALMDRAQGTTVSGTAQMAPADAGEGVLLDLTKGGGVQAAGGGPAPAPQNDAPYEDAGIFFNRGGGQRVSGGCGPGGCPVPQGRTVTTTASPATTTAAPVTTSTATSQPREPLTPEGLVRESTDAAATGQYARAGAAAENAKTLAAVEAQRNADRQYEREYPDAQSLVRAKAAESAALAVATHAEADHTRAMTQVTRDNSVEGRIDNTATILNKVARGEMSARASVIERMRMDSQAPVTITADGKPKAAKESNTAVIGIGSAPDTALSPEGRARVYQQEAYGALAMNVLFTNEAAQIAAGPQKNPVDSYLEKNAPTALLALRPDEKTKPPMLPASRMPGQADGEKAVRGAVDVIVANLQSDGVFDSHDPQQLGLVLQDTVLTPLVNINISRHTEGIDKATNPKAYQAAYNKALLEAKAYGDVIRAGVTVAYDKYKQNPTARPKFSSSQLMGVTGAKTVDSNNSLPPIPANLPVLE